MQKRALRITSEDSIFVLACFFLPRNVGSLVTGQFLFSGKIRIRFGPSFRRLRSLLRERTETDEPLTARKFCNFKERVFSASKPCTYIPPLDALVTGAARPVSMSARRPASSDRAGKADKFSVLHTPNAFAGRIISISVFLEKTRGHSPYMRRTMRPSGRACPCGKGVSLAFKPCKMRISPFFIQRPERYPSFVFHSIRC